MKKLMVHVMTALVILSFVPTQLSAVSGITPPPNNPIEAAQAQVLLNRLEEINTMDKTDLTRSEKKELRKEVREINRELKANSQGFFLSIGAIIIIVLLLVLLI